MISIFNTLESFFTGKVIEDFGHIRQFQSGTFIMLTTTYRVLFSEKDSQKQLIITQRVSSMLGFNITYLQLDKNSLIKLRDIIDKVIQKM